GPACPDQSSVISALMPRPAARAGWGRSRSRHHGRNDPATCHLAQAQPQSLELRLRSQRRILLDQALVEPPLPVAIEQSLEIKRAVRHPVSNEPNHLASLRGPRELQQLFVGHWT